MTPSRDRTPEERERARLEREARRRGVPVEELLPDSAAGDPWAVPPPRLEDPSADAVAPEPVRALDPPVAPVPVREAEPPQPLAGDGDAPPARRPRAAPAPAPPPPRGRRRWAGRILAVLALAAAGFAIWFLFSLFQPFKGDGEGRVVVRIPPNTSARQIGDLLAARGVVSSGFFFSARATLSGKREDLKAGTYAMSRNMSYGAAIDRLTGGPPPPRTLRVAIPEGRSRREAAPLVREAGFRGGYLSASKRSSELNPRRFGAPRRTRSLEGFLFPATYELEDGSTSRRLVREQLSTFKERFAEVDLKAARRRDLDAYDVITIASMIEREAQVARERPRIAAVIYNRLKRGIPLGIDATIRYAENDWTRPLRQSQLERDTPYNTRLRTGLPPTPIGSPGLASLKAAAKPADVPYLFYVVKPNTCGEHAFSTTDAKFRRDVARYNRARRRNGGKAPTTCPG